MARGTKTTDTKAKAAKTTKPRVSKKTVSVDKMVDANKTTGTDFQAYMRKCIQEGKLL